MTEQSGPYIQQRSAVFDRMAAFAGERRDGIVPGLVTDIHDISPRLTAQDAEREAWRLLHEGLRHLAASGPDGAPGALTEALSKASLRSSALAAALQVKPPQFEQMCFAVPYDNGRDEALFFCRRLIEAAQGDIPKSSQLVQQRIYREDAAAAFGKGPDPALRPVIDALHDGPVAAADNGIRRKDLQAVRKQMIIAFNMLVDKYAEACQQMHDHVCRQAPLPPQPSRSPLNRI